ncbi:ion channel [Thalassotalea ganghwensis]
METQNQLCQYHDPKGLKCREPAGQNGLCYWHDPHQSKKGQDVKERLELYVRAGGLTRGIILKYANLAQVDLVNHHQNCGFDFSYADFYRANLTGAHLFNIQIDHGSLMKADLRHAKLNCASLLSTNLLGVKWQGCKIENIKLGKKLKQEVDARTAFKQGHSQKALDYLEQAEEVYRDLRKHSEQEGLFALSGQLIQRELTVRRKQMPRYSFRRLGSKIIDLFCGYGEAPLRIVGISLMFIFLCALLYAYTGLNYQGKVLSYDAAASLTENFSLFLSCLYYSVVTFTTLGYGDFTPVGISRAIAAIEAFTGSFTIALFVVVFVKKMTR